MIENLVDGISLTLSRHFGDDCTIYTERKPQNFKEPSFHIRLITGEPEQFKNERYTGSFQFVIHYYPDGDILDSYNKNMVLSDVLEVITDLNGETYRGKDMRGTYSDDVLNFFITYDMFMDKQTVIADPMESLEHESEVRE